MQRLCGAVIGLGAGLLLIPRIGAEPQPLVRTDPVQDLPTRENVGEAASKICEETGVCDPAQAGSAVEPVLASPPGMRWGDALKQSGLFLAGLHGARLFQKKTRDELGGPFLKDYFRSVSDLGGWRDGDPDVTNYVGHPMMGAIAGFIQIHNDPKAMGLEPGWSKPYVASRLKAMAWSAAFSAQFEVGPLSEASIGNVGLRGGTMAMVDLVITPTLGTGWIVAEDLLDRYVVRALAPGPGKKSAILRTALNPARSIANVIRLKKPWHRDDRP